MIRKIPDEAFLEKQIIRIRDIDAVLNNYRLFRDKVSTTNTICGAVVKAEVHGLLMEHVAPVLYKEGCTYFFVEELSEGINLRKILPDKVAKIFAMGGLLHGEEEYFKAYSIIPCLNSLEQIERWNSFSAHTKSEAVIHLDTHMNRIGLLDDEVDTLAESYDEFTKNLDVLFYMSHFYDIKGDDTTNCYKQLDILNLYLKKLPKNRMSFACTDSTILLDNSTFNFDIVRIGIGLVGGAPSKERPISKDARPAIEIYAKMSQIKWVKKGETVGYGGAYKTKRDTKIALVHVGYKDGYLRSLSETDERPVGAYMCVGGYKVNIIGKISLGLTTVDVTEVPDEILKEYHYAEVIGPNVDMRELADIAGCYEVLAAIGRSNYKCKDYTLSEFLNLFTD